MRLKMSPSICFGLFCCLSVLSVNFGCQKKEASIINDETATVEPHDFFNKNVGGPIDSATGNRWKRNLEHSLSRTAPSVLSTRVFYLPAAAMRNLIASNKTSGICFYFGKDASGNVRLVPVAVDVKGTVIAAEKVITSNGEVSWQEAKQWRLNFKQEHSKNIWGHFWGSVAVERLLAAGTETVRIELGINDEGSQQMMFSSADELAPVEYGDRTRTCPPFCPSDLQ